MKLISMTDFVLKTLNEDRPCNRGAILDEIGKYAKFIKQPLTLEMFVGYKSLFEGFEVIHKDNIRITIQSYFLQIDYNIMKSDFNDLKTIEDLSIFFEDLTLTPYAIKKLGL